MPVQGTSPIKWLYRNYSVKGKCKGIIILSTMTPVNKHNIYATNLCLPVREFNSGY